MAVHRILIPINFTDIDQKALDFVIETYKIQKDSCVTLLHIYIPLPKIETDSSTVMGRLSSSMHFLTHELKEKEKALHLMKEHLLKEGFDADQVDYVFKPRSKPVADEIIETISSGRYNVIVLSYRSQRITWAFVKSVHNKVLASLRDVAVCIVT